MVLLKNVAIISGGIKTMKKCVTLTLGKTTIKKEIDKSLNNADEVE
jgi:hypothetical protein